MTEPQQTIHNEETVINVSKWVCLAIAIVLIVSAAVLILNTIRMAIFARRREVSVMKLVGATNWFIRVPFMSEGLLQGLIGSLLAAVVVYFVYLFINHEGSGRTTSNIFTAMHMSGPRSCSPTPSWSLSGWRSGPSALPSLSTPPRRLTACRVGRPHDGALEMDDAGCGQRPLPEHHPTPHAGGVVRGPRDAASKGSKPDLSRRALCNNAGKGSLVCGILAFVATRDRRWLRGDQLERGANNSRRPLCAG